MEEQNEGFEPDDCELVTIRKIQDLQEAQLTKGSLESAGIECFLADAYMIGRIGQVSLQVRRIDVDAANEILDQPIPDSFEVDGVGLYQQPRCPKCQSLDVRSELLSHPGADSVAFHGLPPPSSSTWKCSDCHNEWQDHYSEA